MALSRATRCVNIPGFRGVVRNHDCPAARRTVAHAVRQPRHARLVLASQHDGLRRFLRGAAQHAAAGVRPQDRRRGHAIAVQNLAENLMTFTMIGGYALAEKTGEPIVPLAAGFGVFVTLVIGALWIARCLSS